jgi:hypothetical protein
MSRDEWTLNFRELGGRVVAELQTGLERHGYRLAVVAVSEVGLPAAPTQPTDALDGARLGITDYRYPVAGAGLTLLLGGPTAERKTGFGMLTVVDQDPHDGTYAEMAQYLIAALGELVPDLRFRRLSSSLAPDPAKALGATLPPQPRHLPRG